MADFITNNPLQQFNLPNNDNSFKITADMFGAPTVANTQDNKNQDNQPSNPVTQPISGAAASYWTSSTPSSSASMNPQIAFQTALNQVRTKMESNNKLIDAKNAMVQHMYDQPLTEDQQKALTPAAQHAISTGNVGMIEAAIKGVNDQIKGYNNTIDTNLSAYATAVKDANQLKEDIAKNAMTFIQNGVSKDQVSGFLSTQGFSQDDISSMIDGTSAMRTDRNMNPTAMTTDVARQAGLVEGVDFVQGDPFTTSSRQTLYTAKFLGDPIQTTIKAIDNVGFYTSDGSQRWSYIGMSQDQWNALSPDDKSNVVKGMYMRENREGGNGAAIGMTKDNSGGQSSTQEIEAAASSSGVDTSGWNWGALSDIEGTTASQILGVALYKNQPPNRFSTLGKQIIGKVDELTNYTYDSTKYPAIQKARTDFAPGGKEYQNIKSLNTAVGHLQTLQEKSDALKNSSVGWWNTVANYGLSATGDPRVQNFQQAVNAVSSEMSAIFKNSGTTDQDISSWKEQINSSESPEQLQGSIKTMVELMKSRLEAISGTYEQTMGVKLPMEVLSPQSLSILSSFGLDPSDYLSGQSMGQGVDQDPLGIL